MNSVTFRRLAGDRDLARSTRREKVYTGTGDAPGVVTTLRP
jgi:hypothetical protein